MKKVLIIAAVLFVVMGIVATAGLVYVGHPVKNRIEKEAAALRHEATRPSPAAISAAAEAPGRRLEAYKLTRQSGMEELVKGIGGMAAPAGAPYLTVTVSWEDVRQGMSMLKGTIAGNSAGVQTTENLQGIGDEAFVGPVDSFLAFVKGQTGVQIDLSQIPHGRDKGVAIARTIANRL
jgi:hypothetical protein